MRIGPRSVVVGVGVATDPVVGLEESDGGGEQVGRGETGDVEGWVATPGEQPNIKFYTE